MKVFEVLCANSRPLNEAVLATALKDFDWRYEFSSDFVRVTKGSQAMAVLENKVYSFWKKEPEKALRLWQQWCPWVLADDDSIPSFILRLQSQDVI